MIEPTYTICGAGRVGTAIASDVAMMSYKASLFELDEGTEAHSFPAWVFLKPLFGFSGY